MSIELMSRVWKIPFPTSTQMVLALKLADHAADDGTNIYPGRASLAARARCSESSVKLILKMFREAGLLIVVEEGGKGPHDTTVYKYNTGLIEAIVDGRVSISGSSTELCFDWSEDSGKKGSDFDPLEFYPVNGLTVRGQPVDRKGSTHSPQTIINHQEPSARERAGAQGHAPASARVLRSIPVTSNDVSWGAWLSEIETRGGDQGVRLRKAAVAAGVIYVHDRWPKPETPLPKLNLTAIDHKRAASADTEDAA